MILPSGVGSYAEYAAKLLSLALQKGNALIARRGATDALAAVVAQGRRPVGTDLVFLTFSDVPFSCYFVKVRSALKA